MKQKLRKETGITLVALVVTIVVLLILAGITIMYTMGENSIFQKAQDAKNKTADAVKNEQEYMNSIDNMVNEYLNGTETPTIDNATTGEHTGTTINYTWEQIDKIAQAIANSSNVTDKTTEVTANIDGTGLKLGVGDIATVTYSGTNVRVRVLGFKHDDLVDTTVYRGNHTKASISFEFLDFMTGDTYMSMNTTDTNENGWGATQMRKDLNGYSNGDAVQSGVIGGVGANLNNKSYIKQVKKKYIATYNSASSVTTCNDYLWLLAASEVVNNGYQAGAYGYAITSEGSQYKYYQGVVEEWDSVSTGRQKRPNESSSEEYWWLRSPSYDGSPYFCGIYGLGGITSNGGSASRNYGVAPGFCI